MVQSILNQTIRSVLLNRLPINEPNQTIRFTIWLVLLHTLNDVLGSAGALTHIGFSVFNVELLKELFKVLY